MKPRNQIFLAKSGIWSCSYISELLRITVILLFVLFSLFPSSPCFSSRIYGQLRIHGERPSKSVSWLFWGVSLPPISSGLRHQSAKL